MPTVAKAPDGVTVVNWGEHVFQFDNGERQVTEAEKAILERYTEEGGPKFTFEEAKKKTTSK